MVIKQSLKTGVAVIFQNLVIFKMNKMCPKAFDYCFEDPEVEKRVDGADASVLFFFGAVLIF